MSKKTKLLRAIEKDTNTLAVKDITALFCGLLGKYFDVTRTGQAVKNKLTEEEYEKFIVGIANSFLSSLYITAGKDAEEQTKRWQFTCDANKDVIVSSEVLKE